MHFGDNNYLDLGRSFEIGSIKSHHIYNDLCYVKSVKISSKYIGFEKPTCIKLHQKVRNCSNTISIFKDRLLLCVARYCQINTLFDMLSIYYV